MYDKIDAIDVGNFFIQYSNYTKTNLQICKLVYISHGYSLAIFDKPLIRNNIEAWDTGPVIPSLYNHFKRFGTDLIGTVDYTPKSINNTQKKLLEAMFTEYGKYCGYYLAQITRDDNMKTPWRTCYKPGRKEIIPDNVIKKYYTKLITV